MKIIHLLDHSLPISDGYALRSRSILRAIRTEGVDPVVVTSPKHEQYWHGACPAEEEIDGVRVYRAGAVATSRLPLANEIRVMARIGRVVKRAAEANGCQLIHVHSPVLNVLPALRVARSLGVPVVYEIRAFWEDAAVDQGTHKEWGARYRLIRALETRACRRADAVVTICRGLRDDLVARGIPAHKITVVPNAVDPDELRPVPPDPELRARWGLDGCFVVGFLGSFYEYEGLDLLLHALARLTRGGGSLGGISRRAAEPPSRPAVTGHESRVTGQPPGLAPSERPDVQASQRPNVPTSERPNVTLLLIGGGIQEARLRALAGELGVADRVVFAGRVPHEQIPAAYGVVDAVAFPRRSLRLTETVTPLKPLEAMSMETPVIASDVGGHRELIRDGETGLLFPAGDPAALAERILALAQDPGLANRLRENGRRWVTAERTWRRNGKIYREVYGRLGG